MSDTVTIAGAGPVGLMLAGDLRMAGVETVVLDPLAERGLRAPGVAVNAASAEILDERGLMEAIRDDGIMLPTVHFSLIWLDPARHPEPHEDAYVIPQARVEELLAERATKLGADIRYGHQVTAVERDGEGVTITVEAAGASYRQRSRYLVGCDGADSTVRRLAGIGFSGTEDAGCVGIVADVEAPFVELDPKHLGTIRDAHGSVYNGAPIGPNSLRIMTVEFGCDPERRTKPVTEAELRETVLRLTGAELAGTIRALARFGDAVKRADRFRDGPVFLAGDAAHVYFAFNGMGLSCGLHDAANLGWKLAASVHGWATPRLLDTYQAERYPVAEQVCRDIRAQIHLLYPPELANPVRELIEDLARFDDTHRYLLDRVTGTADRYPSAPDAAPHPLLGRRLPGVRLRTVDGTRPVAELFRAGRGVLLTVPGAAEVAELAAPWLDRVDVVTAQPDPLVPAEALLLRPDGHVAWVRTGPDDDPRPALAAWFGAPAERRVEDAR